MYDIFFSRQNAGLMSMCSASLDIFTMMEARQGAEISQPMRFVYIFILMKLFVYISRIFFFRQIAEHWIAKRLLELWEDTQVQLRWNRKTKIWIQNECTKRYVWNINVIFLEFIPLFNNVLRYLFLLYYVSLTGSNG